MMPLDAAPFPREDIRLATGVKVTAIRDTADTAALAAYITGPLYPVWPADPYAPQPVSESNDDTMMFSNSTTSGF